MLPADMKSVYPGRARERDRWILAQRGPRSQLDPFKPHAFLVEEERAESGEVVPVATIFLTNRECPWRCLMCDLWKDTLMETVPIGAIPAQIDYALAQGRRDACPAFRQIKLYNSGSFFDPRAIPPEDYAAIVDRVRGFERVIVECHPALVGESTLDFRDLLTTTDAEEPDRLPTPGPSSAFAAGSGSTAPERSDGGQQGNAAGAPEISHPESMASPQSGHGCKLEVAMGLETTHPQVLEKLNKRMTLDQFRRAAQFLRQHEIALRVFVLVRPPFLDETESLHWAKRSLDFAFECGATAVSLIPTRFGNGALEALAARGEFSPPKLATVEAALEYGLGLNQGRVFVDVWDLEKFSDCNACFEKRFARLRKMNLRQIIQRHVPCECCQARTR